jgi:hypothetical protein
MKDLVRYGRLWGALALEMEELWLQTRPRSDLEQLVVKELQRRHAHARQWRDLRLAELEQAYRRAAVLLRKAAPRTAPLPRMTIPSRARLWIRRWNVFSHSLTDSRQVFARFWRDTWTQCRRGHLHRIDVSRMAVNLVQEGVLFGSFVCAYVKQILPHLLGVAAALRR